MGHHKSINSKKQDQNQQQKTNTSANKHTVEGFLFLFLFLFFFFFYLLFSDYLLLIYRHLENGHSQGFCKEYNMPLSQEVSVFCNLFYIAGHCASFSHLSRLWKKISQTKIIHMHEEL